MSETVNIYEAKTRLSQLVDLAAEGEEVIIARAGRPVARLVAYREPAKKRIPGRMRGRIWISPHFDDPLPEFEIDESDLD
jgi:prevent-host-death family protein